MTSTTKCPHTLRTTAGSVLAAALFAGCLGTTETASFRLEAFTSTSVAGTVGMAVSPAPIVRVLDQAGQPVPGVQVSFVAHNGSAVSNSSAVTDIDGRAAAGVWTLGGLAQTYRLQVSATGVDDVIFIAIANPGPAASVDLSSGNQQTANTGDPLPQPLRVLVRDAFGNRVPDVLVAFTVVSGGGSIDHTPAMTDAAGVATSGTWTLGTKGGVQELRASVDNVHAHFTAIACDPLCQRFELLFVREGNLYRTNLGGRVSLVVSSVDNVAVAPDGQRIAFVRWDDDGNSNLYLADVNGANATLHLRRAHSPSWSADGQRLAVAFGSCVYDCDISIVNAADQAPPVGLAREAAQPAWSPDGKEIAFVSLSGDDGYHALHVANADGSNIRVVSPRDPGSIYGISWSPDGARLAFSKCIGGNCDIHVASVDGSIIERRTSTGNALLPTWSPDGTRIAMVLRSGPLGSLAYIDAEAGGNPTVFVSNGWGPVWLPVTESRMHRELGQSATPAGIPR